MKATFCRSSFIIPRSSFSCIHVSLDDLNNVRILLGMPNKSKQIFCLGARQYELVEVDGPIYRENQRFPAQFDHDAGVLRISKTVPLEQRAWLVAVAVSDACFLMHGNRCRLFGRLVGLTSDAFCRRLSRMLKVIDRLGEILPMGGNKTEGFELEFCILLDDPRPQPAQAFRRGGACCDAGGVESAGLISGGPGFSPRDRHGGFLPLLAKSFGIEPKRAGEGGKGGMLHLGGGHRLDGDQSPGGDTNLAAQGIGGFVGLHPIASGRTDQNG